MVRVALVVASPIPPGLAAEIDAGRTPRRDFFELQRAVDALLINYQRPPDNLSWLVWKLLGRGAAHAWLAFRRRADYDIVHTLSEDVGLLLALLFKLTGVHRRHVMVAHWLTPLKRRMLLRLLRLDSGIDRIIVYGPQQRRAAISQLGLPAAKVEVVLHPADHRFWHPLPESFDRLVCSAGLESRDYGTLLRAVEGLRVRVVIAAASPWSKSANELAGRKLPINVELVTLQPLELRNLYARSLCVVVPVRDVDSQAGSLVAYEAMACGRPLIATRTRGLGAILDGEGCVLVPAGDAEALRSALVKVLDHPEASQAMGRAARRLVEEALNLDLYVDRVGRIISDVMEEAHANATPGTPPS